jgi:hypothetical protein
LQYYRHALDIGRSQYQGAFSLKYCHCHTKF